MRVLSLSLVNLIYKSLLIDSGCSLIVTIHELSLNPKLTNICTRPPSTSRILHLYTRSEEISEQVI